MSLVRIPNILKPIVRLFDSSLPNLVRSGFICLRVSAFTLEALTVYHAGSRCPVVKSAMLTKLGAKPLPLGLVFTHGEYVKPLMLRKR